MLKKIFNNNSILQDKNQNNFFILLVALVTAVSGLITVMPVGMHFRFALSSIVMVFLLLFFVELPLVRTGAAVAVLIFSLRVSVHHFFKLSPGMSPVEIMLDQYPSALYYLFVTIFLKLGNARGLQLQPLKLFFLIVTADVGSNILEQLLREGYKIIPLLKFEVLFLVSALRMGLIVGAVFLRNIKLNYDREKLRFEKLMMVASGLSAETYFLQKSMKDMEDAMAKSYELYHQLKKSEKNELSAMALEVSQEVHEIKKDALRIIAGLSKLVDFKNIRQVLKYNEILEMVIKANSNYSATLGKQITFEHQGYLNFEIKNPYMVISIFNNLIVNAVEAIPQKGSIFIREWQEDENLCFSLKDTGIGIGCEEMDLIFEPGFTTKYNAEGSASTGIGLVHVERIIKRFEGDLKIESAPGKGTRVLVKLPLKSLTEGISDESRV